MKRETLPELKKERITAGLNNWTVYFGKKLNKDLGKMYAEILLPYSLKTIDTVIEQVMEVYERFPTFGQVKGLIKNLEDIPQAYHKQSDQSYPVSKMHTALDLLINQGRDRFDKFCEDTGMPRDDIQRVLTRAEVIKHNQVKRVKRTGKPRKTVNSLVNSVGKKVSNHVRGDQDSDIPF